MLIKKEAKLKDLENSHCTHSVKNEKVWQEENTKDVAKRLFGKEISQVSQQKLVTVTQDNEKDISIW